MSDERANDIHLLTLMARGGLRHSLGSDEIAALERSIAALSQPSELEELRTDKQSFEFDMAQMRNRINALESQLALSQPSGEVGVKFPAELLNDCLTIDHACQNLRYDRQRSLRLALLDNLLFFVKTNAAALTAAPPQAAKGEACKVYSDHWHAVKCQCATPKPADDRGGEVERIAQRIAQRIEYQCKWIEAGSQPDTAKLRMIARELRQLSAKGEVNRG